MEKKPFFARFLVGQFPKVQTGVKAGKTYTTKYPSDKDEYVTLKYPSDTDEGGVIY